MNQYWITSFVQTKLNGGGDWQAYGKEIHTEYIYLLCTCVHVQPGQSILLKVSLLTEY